MIGSPLLAITLTLMLPVVLCMAGDGDNPSAAVERKSVGQHG